MAKKKVGLAPPVRTKVTIKGDPSWESYIDSLQEAVEAHKGKRLIRIHTKSVRILGQSGRLLNARRTLRQDLRRTFIFE